MLPFISRFLDRIAIRTACRSVQSLTPRRFAGEPLEHPDYADVPAESPALNMAADGRFSYRSPLPSPEEENNRVAGRLVAARKGQQGRGPAVLLLHGWNGEQGYRFLFPPLARQFARLGLTSMMIELPYHGSRKPASGPFQNFLSGDAVHMMEATRQALADIRAALAWMRMEGYGPVGIWGVSLGAWLGGLVATIEEELGAVVLVTPVPEIDRAIESLEFCRHISASLKGLEISPGELNLTRRDPKLPTGKILIVESIYDLFAPADSVETLWNAWNRPEIWRVRHGHISVLLSMPVMRGTGRWLHRHLRGRAKDNGIAPRY